MTCYRPITAFKPLDGGPILFVERKNHRQIQIPCGQCIGCRIVKRENWALRCYLESKMHARNCFATLTYDDLHLPRDQSLNYTHFQLFMKRARKHYGSFRFFMCGEYGEQYGRPHYHALLFGFYPSDARKCNSVYSRSDLFESEKLTALWGLGSVTIGEVTYESARYCATYCTKRITGDLAESHYERVNLETGELTSVCPEFAHMSLRPGIGMPWIQRYWKEVYDSGINAIQLNGRKFLPPRYFDSAMENIAADVLDSSRYERYIKAIGRADDNTPERLAVREECAVRKAAFNKERFSNDL